ncbi:alpha-glucuronidase family glycosyl hydrolase [Bacillus sp. Marseille-Q1617]|uniref:alpha-glucuronidase family glycosyl hydrolase n=1 Tax=Bacillus sp. Marseille-Q1617 TaxID=2736887 RepID=UPI00158CC5E6|nr:alpha-glucuronidase family glycosyl hydrolase [Bacillus sp. Marseille-Q1617]
MKSIVYFNDHVTTRFAVEELRKLYRKAGIEARIKRSGHSDNQGEVIFLMLENEYNSAEWCTAPLSLKEDGFAIIEQGEQVWVIGKGERSLLYGVYHYCEKILGYNWAHLSEERQESSIKNAACLEEPLFKRRGNIIETVDDPIYINRLIDWGVKNGLNEFFFTFFLWDKIHKYVEGELVKRSVNVTLGGHSLSFLIGEKGNKVLHLLKDCNTQEQVIRRIVDICRESPVVTRVSLWPEDVGIDKEENADFMPAYIAFTEKLKASLTSLNVEVEHIVYNAGLEWNMLERSAATEASREADVLYAYWGRDYSQPIHHSTPEQKRAAASLIDWRTETAKTGRSFTVLEYYSDHFMLSELFPPLLNRMKEDMEDYKELKVDGILNLIVPCHIKPHSPEGTADYPWKWIHQLNNFMYAGLSWGKEHSVLADAYRTSIGERYFSILLELEIIMAKHTSWNVPLFPARIVDPEKVKGHDSSQEITSFLDEVIDFLDEHTPAGSEDLLAIQNKDNYDSFTNEEMLLIYFDYLKKSAVKCKRGWMGGDADGLQ